MKIITLLTDFGTADYFVAAMRGVALSINPQANVVDITHEIGPQNILSGGFVLSAVYADFPDGTINVAVVDPGVGSNRRAILVEAANRYFIAPDNGLLTMIFDRLEDFRVFEITNEKFFHHPVSSTFHGRDIFAPAAAWLSTGVDPGEFGPEIFDFVRLETVKPRQISDFEIEGDIIHIDRFGNLITNFLGSDLPPAFEVKVNERYIAAHLNYYAESAMNGIFSITGSAGFLEIVAFGNSAERLLGARAGDKIWLRVT